MSARKDSSTTYEDPTGLANRLNELFNSLGADTAQKLSHLTSNHGLNPTFEARSLLLPPQTEVQNC